MFVIVTSATIFPLFYFFRATPPTSTPRNAMFSLFSGQNHTFFRGFPPATSPTMPHALPHSLHGLARAVMHCFEGLMEWWNATVTRNDFWKAHYEANFPLSGSQRPSVAVMGPPWSKVENFKNLQSDRECLKLHQ
jgi:hypothetical protein